MVILEYLFLFSGPWCFMLNNKFNRQGRHHGPGLETREPCLINQQGIGYEQAQKPESLAKEILWGSVSPNGHFGSNSSETALLNHQILLRFLLIILPLVSEFAISKIIYELVNDVPKILFFSIFHIQTKCSLILLPRGAKQST